MKALSFKYIKVFYNRKRLHSTLDYKPPIQFLDDWLIAQVREKLVAWNPPLSRRNTEGTSSGEKVEKESLFTRFALEAKKQPQFELPIRAAKLAHYKLVA